MQVATTHMYRTKQLQTTLYTNIKHSLSDLRPFVPQVVQESSYILLDPVTITNSHVAVSRDT